jgi:hypothetical protein
MSRNRRRRRRRRRTRGREIKRRNEYRNSLYTYHCKTDNT